MLPPLRKELRDFARTNKSCQKFISIMLIIQVIILLMLPIACMIAELLERG